MSTQDEAGLDVGIARIFGIDTADGNVQLDDMRLKAAGSLANYGRYVAELFTKQGISLPPPVHLQWWAEGSRILVAGGHPDADRIEVLLNGEGELVGKFKELEVLHEIVRSIELAGQGSTDGQHFNVGITSTGPVAFFSE